MIERPLNKDGSRASDADDCIRIKNKLRSS